MWGGGGTYNLYGTSTRLYTRRGWYRGVCVCVCVCVCVWRGGRVCMTYIGHLHGCTQGRCAHVSVWGVGYV